MFRPFVVALTIVATTLAVPLAGGPRNFVPDWTFTGSALTGFHPVGQADWRAENGEIVGTPKTAAGGWLLLPQSYQDVQFAATFRCRGACTAGVVLRAEKTADAMKGVYISLMGSERGAYAIKVDSQGAEARQGQRCARPMALNGLRRRRRLPPAATKGVEVAVPPPGVAPAVVDASVCLPASRHRSRNLPPPTSDPMTGTRSKRSSTRISPVPG